MKVLHKLKYTLKASHLKGYAIHSPFIFGVVSDLIYTRHPFYSFGNLRDYYSKLTKQERKTALSMKNANRLYRLINMLQPEKIEVFQPDRFDTYLCSLAKATTNTDYRGTKRKSLYFLSNAVDRKWSASFQQISANDQSVWVVKHPTTLNKTAWNNMLQAEAVSASITFFGMGIAFTDAVLPRKNFRIV